MKRRFIMKKYIVSVLCSLALVLFVSTGCFAGMLDGLGLKVGGGTTNYSGDVNGLNGTFSDEKSQFIGLEFGLSDQDSPIQVQTELNYIHDDFDLFGMGMNEGSFNLDYLQIPVLVKVNSPELGGAKLFISTGPYVSVLLNKNRHDISRYDYGYVLSAGVTVLDALTFEVRHTQGLKDIDGDTDNFSVRNERSLFLVGYKF